ncbi:hypothetical protein, partial [Gardnerella vaginalis]|uniref:hypothetical protein n=1 Tax=Gardnerella vaginalis TaxID=2702 RepID=UPI001C608A26
MEPVEIDKSKNKQNQKTVSLFLLASTIQFSNHQTPRTQAKNQKASTCNPRARTATPKKGGGNPGTQKHAQQTHLKTLTIVFHTSNHTQPSVHKNSV